MTSSSCPFCALDRSSILFEDDLVLAIWDRFPVAPGHALLVSRRHVANWFEATDAERAALAAATVRLRERIGRDHSFEGLNLGVNVGEAAGQTVPHLHLHLIPRRRGDVADPRGGVRHVIPGRANYLTEPTEQPRFLTTGGDDPLLPHLELDLARAARADIAVAFVMRSGVERLDDGFRQLLARGGHLRLVTGDYQGITDPDALRQLDDLQLAYAAQVQVRAFVSDGRSFHPKSYLLIGGELDGVAYVGSSNLSRSALEEGVEWNYRVLTSRDGAGFAEVVRAFEKLWNHPATVPLDSAWIEAYRARRWRPIAANELVEVVAETPELPPRPNTIQVEALSKLEETRAAGYRAGLVVLATGLGKTWLAAFDSNRPEFRRVLFVAHREEILAQAMRTFRRIRPQSSFGFYDGNSKSHDAEIVFASVQTLGRRSHLDRFERDAFDYIVVDEFHHASASTYRRLIAHFEPSFLLGLTATPERTDGGDLLALCQENLVHRRDLGDGIRRQLLAPFRYFGVPDDVDYSNIPWRNSRFDEEALTNAVATRARADNALDQWRKRGGQRTLAFCVSQRHSDFMRAHFREAGVRVAAVHSGPGSDPRTSSLERLARGEIQVIFAVDMFNEGVDLPEIDTVMMLRPTESQILWLQQLGRGLRYREGKTLVVIDYIGNHRTFLLKAWTLLQVAPGDHRALAAALGRIQDHEYELPPGCEVTYELKAVEILRSLLRLPRNEEALKAYYDDFSERHGTRPRAVEAYHDQYDVRSARKGYGSWLGFVESMGDLSADEKAARGVAVAFLDAMETTEMVKSFKMLVVIAMLNTDTLPGPGIRIEDLVVEYRRLAERNPRLRDDVGKPLLRDATLRGQLEKYPIDRWVQGRGTGGVSMFEYSAGVFRFRGAIPDQQRAAFQALTRELAEWRLAEYLARSPSEEGPERLTAQVVRASGQLALRFSGNESRTSLPAGWAPVAANGQELEAQFAGWDLTVLRKPGSKDNELPSILRGWFGSDAGLPGTDHQVVLDATEDGFTIVPAREARVSTAELWRVYSREQIPSLFGESFSVAVWNAGFVARGKQVFLLVTLEKGQMFEEHKYADRFLSSDRFEWQSQNRTAQESAHGRLLRDHVAQQVTVHLFVRKGKRRIGGGAAPFVYCGPVTFESWDGERPITVRWRLSVPLPERLSEEFQSGPGPRGAA